eukprot:COSAG02_NODE_41783_length_391_cov_0.616438_1_plen_67_part_01
MSFQPTGDGAAARMAIPDVSAFVISVNSDARFSEAGGDVFVGRAFFKQKAAYGIRIRDWSSDVCSSD